MTDLAISVDNLKKRFGDRVALDGVTFSVRRGEIFGLIGPNGAGKTTTLSVLCTQSPPDAGQVRVAGDDVVHDRDAVRRRIGLVPQEIALYEPLTARQNLRFFGRLYGLRGRVLRAQTDRVMSWVGLSGRADEPVARFSGGMKRRLNLAIALLHDPEILLLDEPTVGVDPQSRRYVLDLIASLSESAVTVLYTTHYMEEAESLCDRVAILDHGRVLEVGRPVDLVCRLGEGVVRLAADGLPPADLEAALRGLPGLASVQVRGDRVQAHVEDLTRALEEVVLVLRARGISLRELEVLRPSLETAFLHLTGRRLRD